MWAEARRRNIGLVAMKVLGGMHRTEGDTPERKGKGGRVRGGQAERAFRYALGLPGLSTVVLGCYDLDELRQAVGWARREPLSEDQQQQLLAEGRRQADDWGEVHGPAEWDG